MKQVIITGKRQADIIDVPRPKSKDDWAVVKIIAAPLCTEYKQYLGGKPAFPLGHEAAGEVVEIARPCEVEVGDRVVVMPQYPCGTCALCRSGEYIHCEHIIDFQTFSGSDYGNGTYAQYILKPSWLLPRIPDDLTYEQGAMLCCGLGPTFGALERMNARAQDTVLITGLGPVGLGGVINATYRNARVIGITNNSYRADLARELGAEIVLKSGAETIAQIMERTDGKGADIAMDCAGDPGAQRLLIDATARNGKVAFIGESGNLNVKISDDLIRKGLTFFGIWHYNYQGIGPLFDLVKRAKTKINKLITHTFPMEQVREAWELQLSRQCGKVVLYPW